MLDGREVENIGALVKESDVDIGKAYLIGNKREIRFRSEDTCVGGLNFDKPIVNGEFVAMFTKDSDGWL